MKLPYAEDINYWKSGKSEPDSWIDKAKKLITDFGGTVIAEAFGSEITTGRSAYMLRFEIKGDNFKVVWPVLPTHNDEVKAARKQAATMLYHDVKAKCIIAEVWGARHAFFQNLLLPDGRMASQLAKRELTQLLPDMFSQKQIEK